MVVEPTGQSSAYQSSFMFVACCLLDSPHSADTRNYPSSCVKGGHGKVEDEADTRDK